MRNAQEKKKKKKRCERILKASEIFNTWGVAEKAARKRNGERSKNEIKNTLTFSAPSPVPAGFNSEARFDTLFGGETGEEACVEAPGVDVKSLPFRWSDRSISRSRWSKSSYQAVTLWDTNQNWKTDQPGMAMNWRVPCSSLSSASRKKRYWNGRCCKTEWAQRGFKKSYQLTSCTERWRFFLIARG